MLSDFLFRVRQYAHENRGQIVRAFLIAAGAIFILLLVYFGIEELRRARYEKRVDALEALFRDADASAKDAERQADALKAAIDAKYDQIRDLEARAANAEAALRTSRQRVEPLKETYEKARDNPDIPADTTCADACTELARLGHPCK
jgi:hypothetical protein